MHSYCIKRNLESKIYGVYMGPIWGRQDPGGSHFGPINLAVWELGFNLKAQMISYLCTANFHGEKNNECAYLVSFTIMNIKKDTI